MRLDTYSLRTLGSPRQLLLYGALGLTAWGCSRATHGDNNDRYAHGRIHVSDATRQRWDASEKAVEAVGGRIKPIRESTASASVPFGADAIEQLKSLTASARHGAGDKRLLSILDTTGGRKAVVSSGIIAEVTLVNGSEYKSESDFKSGWLPLAIVVLPPRPERDPVLYPKLNLHGDTSWIYVHERDDANWVGSVVRIVNGKVEQAPLDVTASADDLEPIVGARFKWEDNDESIWGMCGGNCCKMTVHQSQ